MKRINIRESLIQMDRDTSCKYDLTTMYESVSLTEDKKKELVKYIDAYDIDATNKFLGNEVSSQGLTEFYDDDFSDEEIASIMGGDTKDATNDTYTFISSKSVPDSDGFQTDYTWYRASDGTNVFVFGDNDIYKPEDEYFDHVEEDDSAAEEWFNSYQGFIEGDDMWEELQSLEEMVDLKSANDDTEDKVIDESVNFNLEEIKAVVGGKVSDYLHNELGYGNDFINDYVFVEVTPSDNDRVKVEVRAELGYEELSNLGEVLNNIISTYDSNAYFEPETTGILVAYIGNEDDKGEIDYDTVNRVSDKLNATKSFDELKQVYETEIVPNRDNWNRSTLDVIYTVVDELIDTYKNNESIDENLCESSNVQFGVHQFSTSSIIFRGTEEECGKYIDKHKELWDDAEVYMMTPDDPHYKRTDESLNESILNPNRLFQWAVGILFDMDRFVMDVYDNESWLTYGVGDGEFEETTTQEAKDNYTEHDWLVTDIDTNDFSVEDFTDFLNAFKSATSNKSDYDQVERQRIISEAENLLDTVKMSNKESGNESKSIKESLRPSVLKELDVQDASVKDFDNLSDTDYVVTRYYFNQYAGGVNGSNRDYSVFFGFKNRREALDFRNNHIEFFKSFVKRGKDTPYGEIGATSVKTQVVRKGQVKEPYGCYPNYFKVISTQVQTDEPLKEDYSDEVVTLSRYLDVEVPDICRGVLDLIEHLPSHKISYAAKICRDFYANMESIIKGYVMTGNNFDESLQKDTGVSEDFYPNEGGTPKYAQYKYDTEHKEPRTFPLHKFGTEEDIDDLRNNTDYYVNRYDIKLNFTDSTFTVSGPDSDRFIRDYKLDECISEYSSNDDIGCE